MNEQQADALTRANEIRGKRAELKRHIRAGRVSVGDVLFDLPDFAENMTALDLLKAQFQWGTERALRTLASAQVREGKKLSELTLRQRHRLWEKTS